MVPPAGPGEQVPEDPLRRKTDLRPEADSPPGLLDAPIALPDGHPELRDSLRLV